MVSRMSFRETTSSPLQIVKNAAAATARSGPLFAFSFVATDSIDMSRVDAGPELSSEGADFAVDGEAGCASLSPTNSRTNSRSSLFK